MKVFITIILLSVTVIAHTQIITEKTIVYSRNVKDSFELYISTPKSFDNYKRYDVIYYCDANLKSGKKLRALISSATYNDKISHTIFVGIGHIGDYHVLRRRDFILPFINKADTIARNLMYGQIENFYQFLKTELIPQINKRFKTVPGNNSIVGHSLGGLFAFYCLFKNEDLFKNYFALSPALWIDHYNIYRFNKLAKQALVEKNLYFSAGGLEVMNHIKKGADEMEAFLKTQAYHNVQYKYRVHKGKTHNSQVEESLKYILALP